MIIIGLNYQIKMKCALTKLFLQITVKVFMESHIPFSDKCNYTYEEVLQELVFKTHEAKCF